MNETPQDRGVLALGLVRNVESASMSLSFLAALPTWSADAECKNRPLETWFPGFDGLPLADHLEAALPAKLVCFGCPVKIPCLERAWELQDEYGVSGGLTPQERESAKRLGYTATEALRLLEDQVLGEMRMEAASA